VTDFDWSWPKRIDRHTVEELFGLGFLDDGVNIILLGPNGVGKTMLLRNIAHQTLVRGHTVRVTTASDMLAELADQESSAALARRLRRYTLPRLLCIDEVGYLSYSNRYADLLFEVVTRRYDAQKPIVISTNKAFSEWSEVFPHAACTVTLVCRWPRRTGETGRDLRGGSRVDRAGGSGVSDVVCARSSRGALCLARSRHRCR
jgi:DNA replication protein DnaC